MTKEILRKMTEAIVEGDDLAAAELAEEGLAAGLDPLVILEQGYFPGMQIVGEKFEKCEIWLPDIIMSAEAMTEAMKVLQPQLEARSAESTSRGTVVVGTVKGDVHDIGKNIIKIMLAANGFTVHDLGKDVAPDTFINRAVELDADIIAMSALMTSTMLYMPEVVRKLKEKQLRERFKVVVGGAPVIDGWAREIGADGYAETASGCVTLLKNIMAGGK